MSFEDTLGDSYADPRSSEKFTEQELVAVTLQEDIIPRMAPLFGSFLTEVADGES